MSAHRRWTTALLISQGWQRPLTSGSKTQKGNDFLIEGNTFN